MKTTAATIIRGGVEDTNYSQKYKINKHYAGCYTVQFNGKEYFVRQRKEHCISGEIVKCNYWIVYRESHEDRFKSKSECVQAILEGLV